MDKLILVFYIGCKNWTNEQTDEVVFNIREQTKNLTQTEGIIFFILPDYSIEGIKLDCLNPQLVGKGTYEIILEKLESIEKTFEKTLKLPINETNA